ncbi:MAG: hypothetical protein H6830_05275 [Planctomycetes bacterium]|nr:hypothetical protein [Planctomycetota bacterium]MCB9909233.1 hypothetical protein [Planctomycetota bacterium]HPF15787.1 hypothetical protein [Planctomycetota bacterium]
MTQPPESESGPPPKSYGNMGPDHWSKTRGVRNAEAIDYYRERSAAPGVAEGGGPRNFYCMECDGVIPSSPPTDQCPHCGAPIEGGARRYFNWVEIDTPPASEWKALRPWLLGGLVLMGLLVWAIW